MKLLDFWGGEPALYEAESEMPELKYFPAEKKIGDGAVIIFPGGGYTHRAVHEGDGYAKFLNEAGLDAFVLEYRVSPNRFPVPLLDARRAIRYVRKNAESFGISPDKIAVMGSSAGGHLAALASTYKAELEGDTDLGFEGVSFLPNAQILAYPVISAAGHASSFANLIGGEAYDLKKNELTPSFLADKDTPPAFMWHTAKDPVVSVQNTYEYASILSRLGVAVELHVYPYGNHGLGLANDQNQDCEHVTSWANLLTRWLKLMSFIK